MRPTRAPAVSIDASDSAPELRPILAIVLLVVAVLLGGGHIEGPIRNGLIESIGLAVILSLVWRQTGTRRLPSSVTLPILLFLAILALFLIVSVSLPASFMPVGRDATDAVRALAGVPHHWRPLTLDQSATSRFASSLVVPFAMALATTGAGQRGRLLLLRVLVLLAALSAMLGMMQLALGYPAWASPFGKPDPGVADGLFVNRNHQAMFLLSGLIATGLLIRGEASGSSSLLRVPIGRTRVHLAWLIIPLLSLMTLAAASRAGIGLLCIVLPATIALALGGVSRARAAHGFNVPRWIAPIAILLFVALVVLAMIPSETMTTLRGRMVFSGGTRLDVLPDVFTALGQYWPWGSGPGTFVPVFMGIEDLDKLGTSYLNHVHNEYLEWLIETGLPGLVVLVGGILALTVRLWLVLSSSRSGQRKAMAVAGAGILLLFGLHSAIDYPLRTDANAAVFGLALGLLFTPALDPVAPFGATQRRSPLGIVLLVIVGLAISGQILRLRLAEVASGDANGALAAAIATNDGMAMAFEAEVALASGDAGRARSLAFAAIDSTPLSVVAVRTLATSEMRLGNQAAARSAWRAAAGMGWRDVPTQYWAMRQSLVDHESQIAGMRADALLRISEGAGPFTELTRQALVDPALRHALVTRMALRPTWRGSFFWPGTTLTEKTLAGLVPALLDLQRTAAPPTRGEAGPTMRALLLAGRTNEALALDRPFAAAAKRDPGSLLDDGGFNRSTAQYQIDSTPFDWTFGVVGGATVALDEAEPRAMVVSVDGSSDAAPLTRWIALAPGRYSISFKMKGVPDSPGSIGMRVRCGAATQNLAASSRDPLSGNDFDDRSFTFDVPASCPAILIAVGAFGGGGESEAEIGDIRLTPAR